MKDVLTLSEPFAFTVNIIAVLFSVTGPVRLSKSFVTVMVWLASWLYASCCTFATVLSSPLILSSIAVMEL